MSAPILKLHIDERDNISVRVSQYVQVLTCEEADRIEDEYKRMQAENAKLRELVADAWGYINHTADASWTHTRRKEARDSLSDRIRELGIGVDG